MKVLKIPYQQTGYFSNIILDYLNEDEKLTPFYNQKFNIESFADLIKERELKPVDRKVLVEVLQNQYKGVNVSEITQTNINKLKSSNCYTVTTGHQLNIFTGQLYFIYKIISTINLAKSLNEKYPNNHFVPIYWMATEDHDFEEVNHINLFGNKIELPKTQEGAVGKMKLTGIDEVFDQLKEVLGSRPESEIILKTFKDFYSEEKTFTEATRGFITHLFTKYGLVIVDGDDKGLKSLFAQEFKNELISRQNHFLIKNFSEKLDKLGYKAQISPREINLFYLLENSRERIVFENEKYTVLNTTLNFSEKEIIAELVAFPERFSPNVAIRPMYQEKILPNLAYIGGGAELAYWFQLKDMFDENQISFPILVLRNSVLVVDEISKKRLDKIGISAQQLFAETDYLINEFLKLRSEGVLDFEKEENELVKVFAEIIVKAEKIDASLQPMISAELQKIKNTIQNIEAKLLKAQKQKEEVTVNQIKNVKDKLFPKGALQERHDNLCLLFLLLGFDAIDKLIVHLNPLEKEFKIIEL